MHESILNLSNFEKEKLFADKFYLAMAKCGFTIDDLKRSGWLNHAYSLKEMQELYKNHSSYYNRFNRISQPNTILPIKEEINILFTTGSFAPMHMGHVEMMEQSAQLLKSSGINIDHIIISPSHDNYVLTKTPGELGTKNWDINKRLSIISELIKDKPLFDVDTWESIVCAYAVNFTDVLFYLESYFSKLAKKVNLYYVFGSDNIAFIDCFNSFNAADKSNFTNNYGAVCVERSTHPILNIAKYNNSNLFFLRNLEHSSLSSSHIRTNSYAPPSDIAVPYNKIKN